MIRKYHYYQLQTNPWHREEEPHSNQETPGRQTKQSKQLSLPHQDDCKTRRDIKKRTTKHITITESHNGSNNKQQVNKNRTTALEQTAALATGRGAYMHFTGTKSSPLILLLLKYKNCSARMETF